jgi:hypothetical protein
MASGHSNTDKAPTAPRKQISNSLSDERDIRTFSMMTKLSTLSEHTGYVQKLPGMVKRTRADSARKANLIKALEKKRKIIDNDKQNAVSTHI